MGENEARPVVPVYVYNEDLNTVTRLDEIWELSDSALLPDDPGPPGAPGYYRVWDLSSLNDSTTVTISGRLPLRRMSRKRFAKLLMGRGCPRDFAAAMADYWHGQHVPYAEAWLYMLVFCFR